MELDPTVAEVQRQRGIGEVAPRPTTDRSEVTPTHRRRRVLALVVAATVTLVGSFAFVASRHASAPRTEVGRAAAEATGDVEIGSRRMATTVGWLDGLTSGLILPSDVTSRLAIQNPTAARAVMSAWSDLRATDARGMGKAMRWHDGLTSGLILPSDVTSRLSQQDPHTARIVMAVWKEVGGL